jgi:hypothetical protein
MLPNTHVEWVDIERSRIEALLKPNSGVITPRQQLSTRNPMRDSNKGKG